MPMTPINPAGLAAPLAPYSAGTVAGDVLYTSGILAINADGSVAHVGNAGGQARFILETIRRIVEEGGGSMADIAFNHIFLTDWANYGAVNEVYAEFFPGAKPARYCVQCSLVKAELLVEIASIAHLGSR